MSAGLQYPVSLFSCSAQVPKISIDQITILNSILTFVRIISDRKQSRPLSTVGKGFYDLRY